MWDILVYSMGLIGNVGFGAACIPMAWKAYRSGRNEGIPASAIWMFLIALSNFYGYLTLKHGYDPLVTLIGVVEITSWLTVWRYHYFPRREVVGISSCGTALYEEDILEPGEMRKFDPEQRSPRPTGEDFDAVFRERPSGWKPYPERRVPESPGLPSHPLRKFDEDIH